MQIALDRSETLRARLTALADEDVAAYEGVMSAYKLPKETPDQAELRWRGFSAFEPLPPFLPLTPDYAQVQAAPPWRRTPAGWCTRYGPVDELVRLTVAGTKAAA